MNTHAKPSDNMFMRLRKWFKPTVFLNEKEGDVFQSYHQQRRKYIVNQTCAHFSRDAAEPAPLLNLSLLDIGCGNSQMGEILTLCGADVTAIDTCTKTLEAAKQNAAEFGTPVIFREGSAEDVLTDDRQYDIVLCLDVLEHVTDMDRTIWAISQLLKPHGVLVFSGTTPYSWRSFGKLWLIEKLLGWVPKGTFYHQKFTSPSELEAAFAKRHIKITQLNGFDFNFRTKLWERTSRPGLRYIGMAQISAYADREPENDTP